MRLYSSVAVLAPADVVRAVADDQDNEEEEADARDDDARKKDRIDRRVRNYVLKRIRNRCPRPDVRTEALAIKVDLARAARAVAEAVLRSVEAALCADIRADKGRERVVPLLAPDAPALRHAAPAVALVGAHRRR